MCRPVVSDRSPEVRATTQAPSATRCAIAAPVPEPPPVTKAIRPASGLDAGSAQFGPFG
jgi:hypothetical protein